MSTTLVTQLDFSEIQSHPKTPSNSRPKVPVKDVSTAPKLKANPTFAGMKARSSGVNEKEGDFESKEEQDLEDVKAKDEEGECSVEAEAAISLAEAESEGSVCDESSLAPNEDEEESEYEEEEESEEDLEGEIGEVDTSPECGLFPGNGLN
ncbi:hypothetical protein U1Q18_042812 [Sarracenia purpurea var. burkii]